MPEIVGNQKENTAECSDGCCMLSSTLSAKAMMCFADKVFAVFTPGTKS